jgi:1-acyl-sn-glycerol-3-phosphate acyltransferase
MSSSGSTFGKWLAKTFLRWNGWEVEGTKPTCKKYVMIAAPHTTNWDLPFMLAVAAVAEVNLSWMAKHSLFRIPILGWLLRRMGGIPVVRHERRNAVQQMVDRFRETDEMALAVQPEGTRGRTNYWKSGFYRIALESQVPIVMGYLDYGRRRGGFGDVLMPTGDIPKDMDAFRKFYSSKKGKYPELFGPIQLESEATPKESVG